MQYFYLIYTKVKNRIKVAKWYKIYNMKNNISGEDKKNKGYKFKHVH